VQAHAKQILSDYETKYGGRGLKIESVPLTSAKGLIFNILVDGKDDVIIDATKSKPTPEMMSAVDAAIEASL